jgi:glycosyltransferase involved in cell wall biosynthesis
MFIDAYSDQHRLSSHNVQHGSPLPQREHMMQQEGYDFCLVVPNYDGKFLLQRMLPTLDCPRNRILIVDIDSKDGSGAFAVDSGCNVIGLSRPSSFCQAVNAGVRWALDRKAKYIGISNNDVVFTTPVIGPCLDALESEKLLGIIAPTQVVAQSKPPYELTSAIKYRCTWDLAAARFEHDLVCPENQPRMLEADFCEFTMVVIAAAVFHDIGLLDEQFGFYYEDADFCFRAQLAGWRSAYLQTCQIVHYDGSTISATPKFQKDAYISANRALFHQKHSVRGICFDQVDTIGVSSSWSVVNHFLFTHLKRYGLIEQSGPKMIFNHPNYDDYDILFTIWETDQIPRDWIKRLEHYRHVIVASDFNQRTFRKYHPEVHKISLGIDPDSMSPWGDTFRFSCRKTFLSVFREQHRKAFEITRRAWIDSGLSAHNCELVAYAHGLDPMKFPSSHMDILRDGNFVAVFDAEHNIRYVSPNRRFSFTEMGKIYRGADFFVLNSRSEGFGLPVAEAMACGVPCIVPNYSSTEEFISPDGCIPISGRRVLADYSDKGFTDVGHWWEPESADLTRAFELAASMSDSDRKIMGEKGRQHVLSEFTWRHSAMGFYHLCRELPVGEKRGISASVGAKRTPSSTLILLRRAALIARLLRLRQFGKALLLIGGFLQRRGF